jgi:alkylation response protein AidB-like acyl-CoA dehydrogenase
VAATLDGQPAQFLVPSDTSGLSVTPLTCLDLARRLAHVEFDQVEVDMGVQLGDGDATNALDRQLQIALALVVAETVGAMDALFSITVEYSKDRIAFGRPIGSFQALKHIMADDAMALETCKAGATAAARAVQDHADDAAEIVSMVAAYVGDMSDQLAQNCLQIHGGIGFTWEHDLHLLMRRIRTNAVIYGEPAWLRERVCAFHGLGVPQFEGSAS